MPLCYPIHLRSSVFLDKSDEHLIHRNKRYELDSIKNMMQCMNAVMIYMQK